MTQNSGHHSQERKNEDRHGGDEGVEGLVDLNTPGDGHKQAKEEQEN